jgi:chloride channel protein, CIC family
VFLVLLAFGKIVACSLTIGIGGSGGVFAPSLFIGVASGMAYGDAVHHLFGAAAGQPALYAVVAMGAVFASATRAPLTSLASVVEMTGDFSLTLPVMLAVAIASSVSQAMSYGTIYTTKLLRRGTDIDRTTPWRPLSDLKVTDVMRPFLAPLVVPRGGHDVTDGAPAPAPDWAAAAGPVTGQRQPHPVVATESLTQALRQLEVHGRDGLPVLSEDGNQVLGWVTGENVLHALSREITGDQAGATQAQLAADSGQAAARREPSAPLPGYRLVEVTIGGDSPAADTRLGTVRWPSGSAPVAVVRGSSYRSADPDLALKPGDRVSLLAPVSEDPGSAS